MKKKLLYFLAPLLFLGCEENKTSNTNPYIPNYSFNVSINMDLPAYSKLKFASNVVFYPNVAAKGLYIFYTGSAYNAFDAACPNQSLSDCSTMTVNGINVVCPCNKEEYSLFTGLGKLTYPLKQYRVEVNGSVLRIYN